MVPALAGCLASGPEGAVESGAAASELRSPGSLVQPTGRVVEFTLYIHNMPAHEAYPGATMQMWGFSLDPDPATATVPGPSLRVTAGDTVRVTFRNTLAGLTHTIHWHGVHVPYEADGTPYMSQEPVQPGQEFVYEFVAKPSGTMWYHCHVDNPHHLDMGMYGAFVIEPQEAAEDQRYSREYTLMLDEMDRNHVTTLDPRNENQPQSGDPFDWEEWARRQTQDGLNKNPAWQDTVTGTPVRPERPWWPETYGTYRAEYNAYLINGYSFPFTEPLYIANDEVVRIRLINAGGQPHSMHLHGHSFLVTHKDGARLSAPYWADTLLIGPGERYDLYVRGENPGVWDFHDHMSPNANDNLWPGGMMTVLAYEQYKDKVMNAAGRHGSSPEAAWTLARGPSFAASGAYVRAYALP